MLVCPVIDHEFCHNIVVAMDPWGDSQVDPQTTLTMFWQNSLSVTGQTCEKRTSICFFTITNCKIVCSDLLMYRMNTKFICLSAYWQWKLGYEYTRILQLSWKNILVAFLFPLTFCFMPTWPKSCGHRKWMGLCFISL